MVLLLVVNLTCSQSNAVFLLNLACLVFLFVFMLLALTIVSLPLFVLLVYSTLVTLLFLVNGLVLASSFSYVYYSLSQHSITNRLNFDVTLNAQRSGAALFTSFTSFTSFNILSRQLRTSFTALYPAAASFAYHSVAVNMAAVQFLCLLNFATQPALLNTGINRLANAIFDNSLFSLLFSIFVVNLANLNSMFVVPIAAASSSLINTQELLP